VHAVMSRSCRKVRLRQRNLNALSGTHGEGETECPLLRTSVFHARSFGAAHVRCDSRSLEPKCTASEVPSLGAYTQYVCVQVGCVPLCWDLVQFSKLHASCRHIHTRQQVMSTVTHVPCAASSHYICSLTLCQRISALRNRTSPPTNHNLARRSVTRAYSSTADRGSSVQVQKTSLEGIYAR
jgi:hypothetical protein